MTGAGKSELLMDRAHEALLATLRDGRLRNGQFVSMSQLVDLLDFPIAPVREAVKQASSQGLLVTLPKRGVQVMEASPENIRECLDVRLVYDQEGARRRIENNALEGLETLRRHHEELRDAARAGASGHMPPMAIEVDLSLHNYLSEGLGNSLLQASYTANRTRIAIIQNARPFLQDRIVSAMEEHLAVIEALEKRDAETAVGALRYHCEQTLRWWGVT
ncbi:GntR family transcriptional regulator [Roseibium sp.]|uniref:GntR family transcriptional regulator n=1 Tax=Roseibium sp. TaxID=1936156 RepID=UPI003D0E956A